MVTYLIELNTNLGNLGTEINNVKKYYNSGVYRITVNGADGGVIQTSETVMTLFNSKGNILKFASNITYFAFNSIGVYKVTIVYNNVDNVTTRLYESTGNTMLKEARSDNLRPAVFFLNVTSIDQYYYLRALAASASTHWADERYSCCIIERLCDV